MDSLHEFHGKVIIITGSSTGIGEATAIEFSHKGASVSITGRNAAKLEEVAEKCQEVSPSKIRALVTLGDVTNEEDNAKLIENTVRTFGKLDILVNNAGIASPGFHELENSSMDDYDAVLKTNLRSPYHLTKLAIPHLKKSKSNIVNVSSVASFLPIPRSTCYAMSKAGVDHFTRCIAAELAPSGVRVNCVNPGPVKTGMTQNLSEEAKKRFRSFIPPLGQIGEPQDIADTIAFLASKKASFVTGACLTVDGGVALKAGT